MAWRISKFRRALKNVSAALWHIKHQEAKEYTHPPDKEYLTFCHLRDNALPEQHYHDDKLVYENELEAGGFHFIPFGKKPKSIFQGVDSRILHIYMPKSLFRALSDDCEISQMPELVTPKPKIDPVVKSLCGTLIHEMSSPAFGTKLWIDALITKLGVHMMREYSSLTGNYHQPFYQKGGLAPWQARRVREYLEEHMGEEVTLEELASLTGLSSFHFARMFKLTTGLAPYQYQLSLRIERAKQLLIATDIPITTLAMNVGYQSSQAFARAFRRCVGTSPLQYRREFKK